jgi:hypothetical protein
VRAAGTSIVKRASARGREARAALFCATLSVARGGALNNQAPRFARGFDAGDASVAAEAATTVSRDLVTAASAGVTQSDPREPRAERGAGLWSAPPRADAFDFPAHETRWPSRRGECLPGVRRSTRAEARSIIQPRAFRGVLIPRRIRGRGGGHHDRVTQSAPCEPRAERGAALWSAPPRADALIFQHAKLDGHRGAGERLPRVRRSTRAKARSIIQPRALRGVSMSATDRGPRRRATTVPRERTSQRHAFHTVPRVTFSVHAVFRRLRACRKRHSRPFPQPPHPPSPHATFFFGRVCYFLRKLILKPAEKLMSNCTWKRCAKDVENTLIVCGLSPPALCKNLWITCGEGVERAWRTLRNPAGFLWTKLLIQRILTLQVVFLANRTTTSCGHSLDIRFCRA